MFESIDLGEIFIYASILFGLCFLLGLGGYLVEVIIPYIKKKGQKS